jgi:hypothetical protein
MTDAPPPAPPSPAHPEGHQDRDINVRAVVGFGVALVVVAVAVQLGVAWFFIALRHREDAEKRSRFPLSGPERADLPQTEFGSPATGVLPDAPRLEGLNLAGPRHDVGRERAAGTAAEKYAEDEAKLNGSGDPAAPRIPIEQAMRLVAQERKPQGREPGPMRYDAGVPGTGGGSNSGRDLPEARR